MERNLTVSTARTFGMILIILCHFFGYSDIISLRFLSEVFNVGTPLFLFISGFLYGEKSIGSYSKWFYQRFKRICIPMYIYMAAVFIYRILCVTHAAEPFKYLLYALNLQGVCFVYLRFDYSLFSVKGTDQLWFLTVIMMCYLLVPVLGRLRPRLCRLHPAVAAAILAALLSAQTALFFIGVNISYFIMFAVGYMLTCFWDKKMPALKFSLLTLFTCAALLFRFKCSGLAIGAWYENAVVPISQSLFALWIYFSIFFISLKTPRLFNKIAGGRFFSLMDEYSFFIYITHFMFVAGTLATLNLTPSFPLNAVITLALSIISAVLLRNLYNYVVKNRKIVG